MAESEEMASQFENSSIQLLNNERPAWVGNTDSELRLLEMSEGTYLEFQDDEEVTPPLGRSRSNAVCDNRSPLEKWIGMYVEVGNLQSLQRLSNNRALDKWASKGGVLQDMNTTQACVSFDQEEVWFPAAAVSKRVTIADMTKLLEGLEPKHNEFFEDFGDLGDYSNETQMLPNPETFRQKIWALVEPAYAEKVPDTCLRHTGLAISWFSQGVIVLSVLGILIATLPQYTRGSDGTQTTSFLSDLEVVCIVYFTAEFFLRAVSTPNFSKFWMDAFTWIDLISILPYYVTLATDISYGKGLQEIRVLRVLARVTRVTRVLKVGRHSVGIRLFVLALKRSWTPLCWHTLTMFIMVVTSGAIMFFVERESCSWDTATKVWYRDSGYSDSNKAGDPKTECDFQSIPEALWWAVVTLTTVGYGDSVPVTDLGKALASIVMMVSVLVMTFPLVILTNSFNTIYKSYLWARFRHTEEDQAQSLEADFVKASTFKNAPHRPQKSSTRQLTATNPSTIGGSFQLTTPIRTPGAVPSLAPGDTPRKVPLAR